MYCGLSSISSFFWDGGGNGGRGGRERGRVMLLDGKPMYRSVFHWIGRTEERRRRVHRVCCKVIFAFPQFSQWSSKHRLCVHIHRKLLLLLLLLFGCCCWWWWRGCCWGHVFFFFFVQFWFIVWYTYYYIGPEHPFYW